MANTIILKAHGFYEEAEAVAALLPGSLLELTAAGKVQKHSTAGARLELLVAQEDALQGKTVNDAYAADDVVGHTVCVPGDKVQLVLLDGQTAVIGTPLYSDGAGRVTATDGGAYVVIATAQEALDLSGGAAEDVLIAARFSA